MTDLLGVETDGLAIDFTDTTYFSLAIASQLWNRVRTASVDADSSPHTFFTNGSVYPKSVMISSTLLGWSPQNMILDSQDFTTANWTTGADLTLTANDTTAPDGTVTATKAVATGSTNAGIAQTANSTVVVNEHYTSSVYIKLITNAQWFRLVSSDGTNGADVWFDVVNKTLGTVGAGFGTAWQQVAQNIVDYGSGWVRISQTVAPEQTGMRWQLRATTADGVNTYDSDAQYYIWGGQINAGQAPSTYVRTTSTIINGSPISYGEGLLVEAATTNYFGNGESFASATNANSSETAKAVSAPDGTLTATKLIEASDVAQIHSIGQTAGVTFQAGSTYIFSCYMKQGERTWARLFVGTTAFADNFHCDFDLANGVKGTVGAGATISGITSIGLGWYRCWIGAVADTNAVASCSIAIGESDTDITYNGNGTSGIYIWGAQVELGTVLTSYVPSLGSLLSPTRTTDAVNVATSAYPHSATEGTFIVWITKRIANATDADRIVNLNNGTANEVIAYDVVTGDTPDSIGLDIIDGGAAQVVSTTTKSGSIVTTGNKGAFFYKLNDSGVLIDAGSEVVDASCTMPTVTNLQLGYAQDTASRELDGFIRRLLYVPRRVAQAELLTVIADGAFAAAEGVPMRGLCLSNFGYSSRMVAT